MPRQNKHCLLVLAEGVTVSKQEEVESYKTNSQTYWSRGTDQNDCLLIHDEIQMFTAISATYERCASGSDSENYGMLFSEIWMVKTFTCLNKNCSALSLLMIRGVVKTLSYQLNRL